MIPDNTAQIIMTKPDDRKDRAGIYRKAQLIATDKRTQIAVGYDFRIAGTIIAINIP